MILKPGSRPVPNTPAYQLLRKLGAGAFGEVWRSEAPGGVDVALKFIPFQSSDHAFAELRSLEVMKRLRHPNLVSLLGTWHDDGCLILAMELCDGTLQDRLAKSLSQKLPGIPLDELLGYMRDAANGLDALSAKQVQHRDVKPANLLLLGSGVKVGDFGLAKVLEHSASNTGSGTLGYMAPECYTGKLAEQSDQYSLAATYYHLRAGRQLYKGNQAEVMYAQLQSEPDLSLLPASEVAVLARALSKEPGKRWPSCTAFVSELLNARQVADETQCIQNALLCYTRGVERLNRMDYDLAINDFDEANNLYPNNVHSYILKGLTWLSKRDIKTAKQSLGEAIRRDPKGSSEILNLGFGRSLHVSTGYGTYWELLEGKAGPALQAATIGNLAFSLLGVLNGPEGARKAFLEGILKHASQRLTTQKDKGSENSSSLWQRVKTFWGS